MKLSTRIEFTPSPVEWLVIVCVAVLSFLKWRMAKARAMRNNKKCFNKKGARKA